jgi:hypothetical protein
MRLGCLIVTLALLVAFAPVSWGQSKQPPAQNKQAPQPPVPDQRGTDQAPLSVKILPAPGAEKQAEKQERDEKEKAETDRQLALETQRIADFTRLLAAFTAGLVVVALGQAGLFVWQLRYMRKGMKDAEHAATAANAAALAAQEQVEVAKAQIEVTKIGIFDLERAYLDAFPSDTKTQFVTDPPPASGFFAAGDPMEIVVKVGMKNTGRTRAVISQAYGEFRTGTWLEDKPVYDFSKGTNYVTDLSMAADEAGPFLHDFRTREVVEQFFFGFIAYKDIFKNEHTSRFCVRIFPSSENGGVGKLQLAGKAAWREFD